METISLEAFKEVVLLLLDETFDHVRGFYLDKNTSLFETLADITAEEASIPVGGKCATLAAQVKHVTFYLDFVAKVVQDPTQTEADWGEIWRNTNRVTPTEWHAIQEELRAGYTRTKALITENLPFSDRNHILAAIVVVVHTAYHLGEIRQALCTLRP
ncbi:MAG: hypothetical protein HUU23_04600 [Caldilineales bacterium]|nr:hypothetical protein [Caldilineales bacterium]